MVAFSEKKTPFVPPEDLSAISNLTALSKFFERLITYQIGLNLNTKNLLCANQSDDNSGHDYDAVGE